MAADDQRPQPVVLRIKLRYDDVETMVQRFAPNVGKSGLFLPTKQIQPVGTEIKFELRIANDTPVLVGLGKVKAVKAPDPANPKAAFGLAIELMRVTREGREVIIRMIERRRAMGLADVTIPMPEDVEAAKRADVETQPRADAAAVLTPPAPPPDSAPILSSPPPVTSVAKAREKTPAPDLAAKSAGAKYSRDSADVAKSATAEPAKSSARESSESAAPKSPTGPDSAESAIPKSSTGRDSAESAIPKSTTSRDSAESASPSSATGRDSSESPAPRGFANAPIVKTSPGVAPGRSSVPLDASFTSARPSSGSLPAVRADRPSAPVLAPEPLRVKRPRLADVIARAERSVPVVAAPAELDDVSVDLERAFARARALAGGDMDAELAALRENAAAPLAEISIEAASAELARQLGGSAVGKRTRAVPARGTSESVVAALGTSESAVAALGTSESAVASQPAQGRSDSASAVQAQGTSAPAVQAQGTSQHTLEPAEPKLAAASSQIPLAELEVATAVESQLEEEEDPIAEPPSAVEPPSAAADDHVRREFVRLATASGEMDRLAAEAAVGIASVRGDVVVAIETPDEPPAEPVAPVVARPRTGTAPPALIVEDDAELNSFERALEAARVHTGVATRAAPEDSIDEIDPDEIEELPGESTQIGQHPDSRVGLAQPVALHSHLEHSIDRHLDDAEHDNDELARSIQAAASKYEAELADVPEAQAVPVDDEFVEEEISDLDVLAEADADDADLMGASGERDSQDAAPAYVPQVEQYSHEHPAVDPQYADPNAAQYADPNAAQYGDANAAQYGDANAAQYGDANAAQYADPNAAQYGDANAAQYADENAAQYADANAAQNAQYADANAASGQYADGNAPQYADANAQYADANAQYADANAAQNADYAENDPAYATQYADPNAAHDPYAPADPAYAAQYVDAAHDPYGAQDPAYVHDAGEPDPIYGLDDEQEAQQQRGFTGPMPVRDPNAYALDAQQEAQQQRGYTGPMPQRQQPGAYTAQEDRGYNSRGRSAPDPASFERDQRAYDPAYAEEAAYAEQVAREAPAGRRYAPADADIVTRPGEVPLPVDAYRGRTPRRAATPTGDDDFDFAAQLDLDDESAPPSPYPGGYDIPSEFTYAEKLPIPHTPGLDEALEFDEPHQFATNTPAPPTPRAGSYPRPPSHQRRASSGSSRHDSEYETSEPSVDFDEPHAFAAADQPIDDLENALSTLDVDLDHLEVPLPQRTRQPRARRDSGRSARPLPGMPPERESSQLDPPTVRPSGEDLRPPPRTTSRNVVKKTPTPQPIPKAAAKPAVPRPAAKSSAPPIPKSAPTAKKPNPRATSEDDDDDGVLIDFDDE